MTESSSSDKLCIHCTFPYETALFYHYNYCQGCDCFRFRADGEHTKERSGDLPSVVVQHDDFDKEQIKTIISDTMVEIRALAEETLTPTHVTPRGPGPLRLYNYITGQWMTIE